MAAIIPDKARLLQPINFYHIEHGSINVFHKISVTLRNQSFEQFIAWLHIFE